MRLIEIPDDGIVCLPIMSGDDTIGVRNIDLSDLPTVDAVPVVRCKDCVNSVWIEEDVYRCTHPQWIRFCKKDTYTEGVLFHGLCGDDFCSYGERRAEHEQEK